MSSTVLKNIKKTYGTIKVIHNFNLTVRQSEFVVIIGPSGSGKSTLLRIMAGLEEVSSGQIFLGGQELNSISRLDRNIAMVFQNYALYPHMSVFQNMALGLKLRKYSKGVIKEKIIATSQLLHIDDLLQRKPSDLSGGQKQRVAIGRAMVRDPALCLFDEPLSNLDVNLRSKMRLELKQIHDTIKNTVVYVTHDQVEAMTLADRIVVMQSGKIEQIGTPYEIFEKPKNLFVAQFTGLPAINIFSSAVDMLQSTVAFQQENTNKLQSFLPPKANLDTYAFGIRPEDFFPVTTKEKDDTKLYFEGHVFFIEILGATSSIYIQLSNNIEVICSVQGIAKTQIGEKFYFAASLNRIHIFDKQTEERILF